MKENLKPNWNQGKLQILAWIENADKVINNRKMWLRYSGGVE